MMRPNFEVRQSAPACQLNEIGTEMSYEILLKAARSMSQKQLNSLEGDLRFYSETGLIGVQMSGLLVKLHQNIPANDQPQSLAG